MGKPVVQVLCGMIASGKSTYARNAAAAGAVIINDNAIVSAVHGGDYTAYDHSLKPLYKSVENHLLAVAVALGRDVVVDRGVNVRRRSRQRWVAMTDSLDCEVVAVVFPREEPAQHAHRRCESDPRGHDFLYWSGVAETHDLDWQDPSLSEGFEELVYVDFYTIKEGFYYPLHPTSVTTV